MRVGWKGDLAHDPRTQTLVRAALDDVERFQAPDEGLGQLITFQTAEAPLGFFSAGNKEKEQHGRTCPESQSNRW